MSTQSLPADQQPLPLKVAAKLVPSNRTGKQTSAATLRFWARVGRYGVKLAATRQAGAWFTTEAAVKQFLAEGRNRRSVKTVTPQ